MSSQTARRGKVARLPFDVRETINTMIRDGATSAELNAFLVNNDFERLNGTNWSNWRKGGYQDWLKEQTRIDLIRAKHETIRRELEAGGFSVLDKAIYEVATNLADSDLPPNVIANSIASLKRAVTMADQVDISRDRIDITREALEVQKKKFQRDTCRLFLEWAKNNAAVEIVSSEDSVYDKIDSLGKLMFAEDW